jgi:hypothetical protein
MSMRVALAAALICVLGVFVLDMSGSARRLTGTNHIDPLGFVATVPANGTVCQPIALLPSGTASVRVLIGTYGRPVPTISSQFTGPDGKLLASGSLPTGTTQGYVDVPLRYAGRQSVPGTICLRFEGNHKLAIGGEALAASPTSASVNGRPQPAGVALYYLRRHPESWWQSLPTVVERFGFGKAAFFGDWTLPTAALLLLGTWIATIRLLLKETT